MTQDIELAWAAGFFDGEGCFSRSNYRVRVIIQQSHPEVLQRFADAVGFGKVHGPRTRSDSFTQKPFWTYCVNGPKAEKIADLLWPYLGSVKKEQFLRQKELTS